MSLLKQYFLLLITFCTYFERSSNFEFEAVWIFYVIVSQCKWVSGVDTYEAEIAADSIIWELFARKSAECLNLHNSFITISRHRRGNDQRSCHFDGWSIFQEEEGTHGNCTHFGYRVRVSLCSRIYFVFCRVSILNKVL